MYFRIEHANNFETPRREYSIPFDECPCVYMKDINNFIAEEIRKQINGSKDRRLLSYSKTLGTALLKYNKYVDNELHIDLNHKVGINEVELIYENDINKKLCFKRLDYNIIYGIYDDIPMTNQKVRIIDFIIDVSNDKVVDEFLFKNTGIHKKKIASCEKDMEVLMLQSQSQFIISQYMNAIYILYALEKKYRFLKNIEIYKDLKYKISRLDERYFEDCFNERKAILWIIDYLYYNGDIEMYNSDKIIESIKRQEHISCYYDAMLQFFDILECDFYTSYNLCNYYNFDILTETIFQTLEYWKDYIKL